MKRQLILVDVIGKLAGEGFVEVRCDRCRHWARHVPFERDFAPPYVPPMDGTCSKIGDVSVVGYRANDEGASEDCVYTKADFGCALFTEKP